MKHFITGPAAAAMVGSPAAITAYETQLQNDRNFNGQPFSRVTCIAVNAGGESVTIDIPGGIAGLSSESVAQRVSRLDFPRVKFTELIIEVKGAEYNRITYSGTAAQAELYVPPTSPTTTK